MKKTIYPVILSGGAGSRLWPLSRSKYPKQFLPLLGKKSLFTQTLERVAPAYGFAAPLVVANEHHRFMINEQAAKAGIELSGVLLEPMGRNTAPAVAIAALRAAELDADALLLFLPSDHVILDAPGFHKAVNAAACAAKKGYLVCFGMEAMRAETGYGYIAEGEEIEGAKGAYTIAAFKEKPDETTAETYLKDGGYHWNSGMFMFAASSILAEFECHQPIMLAACKKALESATPDMNFHRLGEAEFGAVPAESIDYAIMEKTSRAAVLPADFGWSDVGCFSALADVQEADDHGNVCAGDIITVDTKNCFIHGDGHLVTTVGVENLIIVATDDAVMVADKNRDQDVKKIVAKLKAEKRAEADFHATVYRPWGNYRTLDIGDRFQVKEIQVYPGKRLSLQMHHHRAEHWIVVEGSAVVTRNKETMLLSENESVYLPLGATHRLENPGKITLRLIEVQSGSYLGEDDIVRFEDDFNREKPGSSPINGA